MATQRQRNDVVDFKIGNARRLNTGRPEQSDFYLLGVVTRGSNRFAVSGHAYCLLGCSACDILIQRDASVTRRNAGRISLRHRLDSRARPMSCRSHMASAASNLRRDSHQGDEDAPLELRPSLSPHNHGTSHDLMNNTEPPAAGSLDSGTFSSVDSIGLSMDGALCTLNQARLVAAFDLFDGVLRHEFPEFANDVTESLWIIL